jgi:hypothetical protein
MTEGGVSKGGFAPFAGSGDGGTPSRKRDGDPAERRK